MTAPLSFRPHHFLCALGFRGKGYSDRFTANMTRLVSDGLHADDGDETMIRVVGATDDICAPCPKRRGTLCTSQARIAALDAAHAHALALHPGDTLTWGQAKARIRMHVQPGALESLCAGCQWLPLGLCESALTELHASE